MISTVSFRKLSKQQSCMLSVQALITGDTIWLYQNFPGVALTRGWAPHYIVSGFERYQYMKIQQPTKEKRFLKHPHFSLDQVLSRSRHTFPDCGSNSLVNSFSWTAGNSGYSCNFLKFKSLTSTVPDSINWHTDCLLWLKSLLTDSPGSLEYNSCARLKPVPGTVSSGFSRRSGLSYCLC